MADDSVSYGFLTCFKLPRIKERVIVNDSKAVFEKFKSMVRCDREVFQVLYMMPNNMVIHHEVVSIGCQDSAPVPIREVMKVAILRGASAMIFIHHHPSGDVVPSVSDVEITRQLVSAGELLGLRVHDHIIIGEGKYYSFADEDRIEQWKMADALKTLTGKF